MSDAPPPRQLPVRLIAIVFAGVFGLLALGYFLFLRPGYVPVFNNLRPAEASAVVAQLDAKNIAYRLADNGASIAFEMEDFDAAIDSLREHSIHFKMEPFSTPVCRMAFVIDPEGNTLCIHKRNPGHH